MSVLTELSLYKVQELLCDMNVVKSSLKWLSQVPLMTLMLHWFRLVALNSLCSLNSLF